LNFLTPHTLRHACGKSCVDRGVDIRAIAEALGHDSLESTRVYTQVSFERTRQIAQLFDCPGVKTIRAKNGRTINSLAKAVGRGEPPRGRAALWGEVWAELARHRGTHAGCDHRRLSRAR
jgi:Phage integrase family